MLNNSIIVSKDIILLMGDSLFFVKSNKKKIYVSSNSTWKSVKINWNFIVLDKQYNHLQNTNIRMLNHILFFFFLIN